MMRSVVRRTIKARHERDLRHVVVIESFFANTKKKKKWHVPILAMTADVIQATYDECVRCNMDGFVSKPFEEEQLYNAVRQVLKPRGNAELQ